MRATAWNVYVDGKWVDTVWFTNYEKWEVLKSLVGHDGYDPRITVRKLD